VDRIAKNAECNKNLIYVYFQGKEALFATVLDRHRSGTYAYIPFTPGDLPGLARRVFDYAQANRRRLPAAGVRDAGTHRRPAATERPHMIQ
jgi:AcrR family transcriptional regulator